MRLPGLPLQRSLLQLRKISLGSLTQCSHLFEMSTSASSQNLADFTSANKQYQSKFSAADAPIPPARKVAVVTCMDARLHPEAFLGLNIGDAHVIRNAGGRVSDDALRSLIISERMLGTREIFVIHHTECGMESFENQDLYKVVEKDLGQEALQEVSSKDFLPFKGLEASVRTDINIIRNSKAIPKDIPVHGFVYDVKSGALKPVS